MRFSGWLFGRDEFHSHFFPALGQLAQHSLAIAFFVVVLALTGVFRAVGEYRANQPRQLLCGGGHRFGLVHAREHPAELRARRRLEAAATLLAFRRFSRMHLQALPLALISQPPSANGGPMK